MAKDTYYFPHDSNARNDMKLIKVRRKYKMVGYGAYFAIIEILREQADYCLPVSDIADIAYEIEVKEEILHDIVANFGLFICENNSFFSPSLLQRMMRFDATKAKRSEAGKIGGEASAKQKASKRQANVKQTSTIFNEESRVKESIGDKSKEEESRGDKSKKAKAATAQKILFRESVFFDLEKFKSEFLNTKYAIYNLEFYYEKVLNWSNSADAKKIDWIATARNFMLGDAEKGRAALQNQNLTQNATASKNYGKPDLSDYKAELARKMGGATGESSNALF